MYSIADRAEVAEIYPTNTDEELNAQGQLAVLWSTLRPLPLLPSSSSPVTYLAYSTYPHLLSVCLHCLASSISSLSQRLGAQFAFSLLAVCPLLTQLRPAHLAIRSIPLLSLHPASLHS